MLDLRNIKEETKKAHMEVSEIIRNYDYVGFKKSYRESSREAHKEIRELRRYARHGK